MLKTFHFLLVFKNISLQSSIQLQQFLLTFLVPGKTLLFSKDKQNNMIKSKNSGNEAGHPEVALPPTSWVTMGKLPDLPEPISSSL